MRIRTRHKSLVAVFLLGMLASTVSLAERPGRGGGGADQELQRGQRADERGSSRDPAYQQRDRQQSGERRDAPSDDRRGRQAEASGFFGETHRNISRDYFRQHYSDTRCPPGLAKKRNGCMPPGLAKKWSMGRPLPRDVIFHDLPRALLEQFGAPPPRHRYVRVDSDILLIEMGTGIVLDVIENLGW
jgi:Ni/Co efflux regulator RcnB